jgi:hypothetical protein
MSDDLKCRYCFGTGQKVEMTPVKWGKSCRLYQPCPSCGGSGIPPMSHLGCGADPKNPVVYEVVPEGEIEDDPDNTTPGFSYACPKARIIAIHKIPGNVIKKIKKRLIAGK